MGIFSADKKVTTNTTAYNTQIGLENVDAPVVIGDGSITYTDAGAVAAAHDVGLEALRVGQEGFREGADLAGRAIDAGSQATRDALSLTGDALAGAYTYGENISRNAIGEISTFGSRAIGEVADAQAGVLDFARDIFSSALGAQESLTSANISGLTGLARQTSESADDRVTRVVMYIAIAVAAIFILPKLK